MTRRGNVFFKNKIAGIIEETDEGKYRFTYDANYRHDPKNQPISLTLPMKAETYEDRILFPFFDGLIPEGWLLDLTSRNWKISSRDRMGLLLTACRDCIGAVHIEPRDSSKGDHEPI
ncbi:MAG: HipA N-terminal domain-containing protein [Pseudobdellovibrionaceae bacterium]|nr:HipA N-terminal domain-containing protein [Pseudobdellovibrionaceae bacterium]